MLSVWYFNCIKEHEEESEGLKKFKEQDSPFSSSYSSRASSPLPSGFSDISVDESELLEEFLNEATSEKIPDDFPLSDHSSMPSSWNLSGSSKFSNRSKDLENSDNYHSH